MIWRERTVYRIVAGGIHLRRWFPFQSSQSIKVPNDLSWSTRLSRKQDIPLVLDWIGFNFGTSTLMGKQDWDWDVSIGYNFDTSLKMGKPYWDYERNVVSLGRLPARLQCPEHARVIASRRHWDPSWFHMRTKKSLQLMSQGYRVSWRYFKISCQLVLLCSI